MVSYRLNDTVVFCDPIVILRITTSNGILLAWYSLLTGELLDASLQGWN